MEASDMKILQDKLVLITGAGSGNGEALSKGLANYGAEVIATDMDGDSAARTAESIISLGGKSWSYELDITDLETCKAVSKAIEREIAPISVLINNAGIIRRNEIDDDDAIEAWKACMDVNAGGAFNMVNAFANQLKMTKGNIVNMTSITAFVAARTFPGYAASKGAVVSMTKALAAKMAEDGVRVNAVAPGPFATPMTAVTLANEGRGNYYKNRVLLNRFGDPAEIVGPVAFMASDMASFVTGETLIVDGGLMAE
jgi:NAD(P)-dependent dehydrogenase (short-subunit alcohol dehydrogenase family)